MRARNHVSRASRDREVAGLLPENPVPCGETGHMKLWLCRWPNGQVSIVRANTPDEAVDILDEQGEATHDMLSELGVGKRFLLTVTPATREAAPNDERLPSSWSSIELGEDMDDELGDPNAARVKYDTEQSALRRERFAALGRPCPTCGTTFPKTD